jgi:hypothetical protein
MNKGIDGYWKFAELVLISWPAFSNLGASYRGMVARFPVSIFFGVHIFVNLLLAFQIYQ